MPAEWKGEPNSLAANQTQAFAGPASNQKIRCSLSSAGPVAMTTRVFAFRCRERLLVAC